MNLSNLSFELSELKEEQKLHPEDANVLFTFQRTEEMTAFQSLVTTGEYEDINKYIDNSKKLNLWRKQEIDSKSSVGAKAIHYACGNKLFKEVIELLLGEGADINATTDQGMTVAHLLSYYNHVQSLIWFNQNYNLDISLKDFTGCTPLYWAVYNNSINSIAFLLFKGADVNMQDNEGLTPLHLSLMQYSQINMKEKVKVPLMLLNQGASLKIKDNLDLTPMDYATTKDFNHFTHHPATHHKETPLMQRIALFSLYLLLLVLFPFFSCLFVLLPVINDFSYYFAYVLLCFASCVSFVIFQVVPSGDSSSKPRMSEFKFKMDTCKDYSSWCLHCLKDISNHSYCIKCKHCITQYYKTYFCQCVGWRNSNVFVLFILFGMAFAFINLAIAFQCMFSKEENLSKNDAIIPFMLSNSSWLYSYYTKVVIGVFILIESMILIILQSYALFDCISHFYCRRKNNSSLNSNKQ